MKISHINIRSLRNKWMEIDYVQTNPDLTALAITEHWIRDVQELKSLTPEGYNLGSVFCRKTMAHGGSLLYVKEDTKYETLTDIEALSEEGKMEFAAVALPDSQTVIISVYRTDNVKVDVFTEKLFVVLSKIRQKPFKNIFLTGDCNLDILDTNSNSVKDFLNSLLVFDLRPTIFEKTRYASSRCIDNIFTNLNEFDTSILSCFSSDHLGISLACDISENCVQKEKIKYRQIKDKFSLDMFFPACKKSIGRL